MKDKNCALIFLPPQTFESVSDDQPASPRCCWLILCEDLLNSYMVMIAAAAAVKKIFKKIGKEN